MALLSNIIPIEVTSISGVPITAAQAGYLAGANFNTAPNKCILLNTNRTIYGINNLSAISLAVSNTAFFTKLSDYYFNMDSNGNVTDLNLTNAILDKSITGSAILTGNLTTESNKICSTKAISTYMDTAITTAINNIPYNRQAIPSATSNLRIQSTSNTGVNIAMDAVIAERFSNGISQTKKLNDIGIYIDIRNIDDTINSIQSRKSNTWYYIWVAHNSTNNTTGCYINEESNHTAVQPILQGFDYYALVGCLRLDANKDIIYFRQRGLRYTWEYEDVTLTGAQYIWPNPNTGLIDTFTIQNWVPDLSMVQELHLIVYHNLWPQTTISDVTDSIVTETASGDRVEVVGHRALRSNSFDKTIHDNFRTNTHKLLYAGGSITVSPATDCRVLITGFRMRL